MSMTQPSVQPETEKRIDHYAVALDIIAMLADRGLTMSDAKCILAEVDRELKRTPLVRLPFRDWKDRY